MAVAEPAPHPAQRVVRQRECIRELADAPQVARQVVRGDQGVRVIIAQAGLVAALTPVTSSSALGMSSAAA